MVTLNRTLLVSIAVCLLGLAGVVAVLAPDTDAQEARRGSRTEALDEKRWDAVAPGRVEPWSGEIKVSASAVGRIAEVLVKVNDKVFAGELLVRLDDDEARARVVAAEAQVAMRKRARNDQAAARRSAERRKNEDAVADAERAIAETRSAVDRAAAARRAGGGSDKELETARAAWASAQEKLRVQQAELRKFEADPDTPLPSRTEGELSVGRAELAIAETALEKLAIRAPSAGTVLQINAKVGELASPTGQPLLVIGDVSALRVRAEIDERDFGLVKIGQRAIVRATAFRGRDFEAKVSSIAPLVGAGRIVARGQRNFTDVHVTEVVIDLAEPGPLAVGMQVDVYFTQDAPPQR
jgi:HlyD family secretion protein